MLGQPPGGFCVGAQIGDNAQGGGGEGPAVRGVMDCHCHGLPAGSRRSSSDLDTPSDIAAVLCR